MAKGVASADLYDSLSSLANLSCFSLIASDLTSIYFVSFFGLADPCQLISPSDLWDYTSNARVSSRRHGASLPKRPRPERTLEYPCVAMTTRR